VRKGLQSRLQLASISLYGKSVLPLRLMYVIHLMILGGIPEVSIKLVVKSLT